jgi:hypothetical protein
LRFLPKEECFTFYYDAALAWSVVGQRLPHHGGEDAGGDGRGELGQVALVKGKTLKSFGVVWVALISQIGQGVSNKESVARRRTTSDSSIPCR